MIIVGTWGNLVCFRNASIAICRSRFNGVEWTKIRAKQSKWQGVLARLGRQSGSKRTWLTRSKVSELLKRADHAAGSWATGGSVARGCARSSSPLPPLFNHLTFFFLRDGPSRPSWGEFMRPRARSHHAPFPEVQRYLAWISLSLSLSLSFLPRRVHVYFFIIFRLYSTIFLQYLQNSDLYLTFSREFFIFERCHNFPCLRWTRRFGIFYIVYVCTLKMLWLRRMCVSQKKIKRRKWRISFM